MPHFHELKAFWQFFFKLPILLCFEIFRILLIMRVSLKESLILLKSFVPPLIRNSPLQLIQIYSLFNNFNSHSLMEFISWSFFNRIFNLTLVLFFFIILVYFIFYLMFYVLLVLFFLKF